MKKYGSSNPDDGKVPSPQTFTRRDFLRRAGAAVVAPTIVRSGVIPWAGRQGANDRIVTGHIGIGGMGTVHLSQFRDNVGALCDVDKNHLDAASKVVGRKIFACSDYRRILDRKDIDAVVIATPDHWHGVQTVHACEAGKDVYCQKPASRTIEEGQAMIKAGRRYGRVIQIGSQGRSTPDAHAACTYIRNGQIGAVSRVECWHVDNPTGGDTAAFINPPPELDWDMWLGPSRWKPYNPDYCHFNFRWMLDWGGGSLRDRGAHVFSVVLWCLNLDETYPNRVTAKGQPPMEGLWDVPTTFDATFEYDNPKLTIVWGQPGKKVADHDFGAVFQGTNGSLILRGGDGGCYVEDKARSYVPPANGVHVFQSPGHEKNFLDCMKTRERPIMDVEYGVRVAVMCNLADISYRLGRTVEFDAKTEQIVNDEEANRLLGNSGRGPWHV